MKPSVAAALLILSPFAAQAGGPTGTVAEVLPATEAAPAALTDWSGLYVGAMAGNPSGHMQYYVLGAPDSREDVDGSLAGVFAGYNVQNGAMVYGAEIAYSSGDVEFDAGYGFTKFLDLKARVGYATGRSLIYGTVGYTRTQWKEEDFAALDGDGLVYGLGLDYQLGERLFLGGEYLWRDVETDDFPAPIPETNVRGDFGTLSLRLGFSF